MLEGVSRRRGLEKGLVGCSATRHSLSVRTVNREPVALWPPNYYCLRCICVGPLPIVAQTGQRNRLVHRGPFDRPICGMSNPAKGGIFRS